MSVTPSSRIICRQNWRLDMIIKGAEAALQPQTQPAFAKVVGNLRRRGGRGGGDGGSPGGGSGSGRGTLADADGGRDCNCGRQRLCKRHSQRGMNCRKCG
jgi:hypothetical protein